MLWHLVQVVYPLMQERKNGREKQKKPNNDEQFVLLNL
jgi:hypothetical protein